MNQVQLNTQGLLESIEERLAQIEALVSSAHRTISSYEASLYMQEAAELLQVARELVQEARSCSSSLSAQLTARPNERTLCFLVSGKPPRAGGSG